MLSILNSAQEPGILAVSGTALVIVAMLLRRFLLPKDSDFQPNDAGRSATQEAAGD